uniref:Uncharacterized protein n=1 Tax=Leersia perrieri TaxID=77586 RepID=A0A0G2KBH9_9ORYZ
MVERYPAL